jgi:RHS repeat-associated protein
MRRFILFASLFLSAVNVGFAQSPQTGIYEFGPYDSPGFDTINRGNLNVHLSFPIFSKPGRAGTNFNFSLNYDGLIWNPVKSGGTTTWVPSGTWGWETDSNAEFGSISYKIRTGSCTVPPKGLNGFDLIYSDFAYVDHHGTAHPFNYSYVTACNGSGPPAGSGTYTVTDNSGYTIYQHGSEFEAFTKTGEQYAICVNASTPGTYTDSNGNQITASSSGVFTDTLGTTALTVTGSGTPSSPIYYTYTDTTGTSRSVKVNYSSYNIATNFQVSGIIEDTASAVPLISSIVYPDQSQYSFTYEQTPGSSSTYTGRLASVTLTSGGKISYVYTGGSNGIEPDGSTSGLTRITSDGSTSYVRSGVSSTASTTTYTDATTPTANTTVSTFLEDTQGYIYETSRSGYTGAASGTPLQQVTTCYSQSAGCPSNSVAAPIGYVTTTLTQNGFTIATDTKQYSGGFLINDNDGYVNEVIAYQSFTGPNNIGFARVSSVTDTDTASSKQIGGIGYLYDQTTPSNFTGSPQPVAVSTSRANLTNINPWLNTTDGTFGATTIAYDTTGSPQSSTGPTGGITNYGYEGTGSYVQKLTPPTPSSGVSLSVGASYDMNTGLPSTATDANSNVTNYSSYNSMLQPLEIDNPDNMGSTQYSWYNPYRDNYYGYSIVQSQSEGASSNVGFQMDGYGRPSRQAVESSNGTWYLQDTCYDVNGRVHFKSYPYQGVAWSTSPACSGAGNTFSQPGDAYSYDAIGRLVEVSHWDKTNIRYSYYGHATEVVDENLVSRISQIDGHGRIVTLCEITTSTLDGGGTPVLCGTDGAGSTMGYLTTYAYTVDTGKNQVTTVTQGQQTRTFKTDSLGRTVSVTEPERGTTAYTYAYNSTGLQVTRKRPEANQTSATVLTTTTTQYDVLNRVVSVNYLDNGAVSNTTPSKTFIYDSNPYWSGETATNLKGRLGNMGANLPSGASHTGAAFSYDAMGRVIQLWQCGPSTCGTANQASRYLTFTYDWTGNLTSETDGGSGYITYGRSLAGEVTSITNNTYSPTSVVSGIVNGPNGPVSYSLGNGLSANNSYDALGRLNGTWTCTGGSIQPGCPGATQIYGNTVTWSGTQASEVCDIQSLGCVLYKYNDGFNRPTSMSSTSNQQLYTYDYDRYGNRWHQTALNGGTSFNQSFSATTNQIVGYSYDAAGNMLSDGIYTYTYDGEGNVLTMSGNGTSASYVYDAQNKRARVQTGSTANEFLVDFAGRQISTWNAATNSGNEGRIYWDGKQIAYRAADGTTYFEHQDYLGTERVRTNAAGSEVGIFQSLPWGDGYTPVNVSGDGGQDTLHFTGLDQDADYTENARFRNYSPAQGRWLSPDPYDGSYDLTNPQSFNRYAYVRNNPLSFVDPSGLNLSVGGGGGGSTCANDPVCQQYGGGGGGGGGGCDPDDASCSGSGGGLFGDPWGGPPGSFLGGNDLALQAGNSWYTTMVNCGFNPGSCDNTLNPNGEYIYVNCGGSDIHLSDLSCLPDFASMGYFASGTQPYFRDVSMALAYQISGEAGWIGTPEGVAAFYGASLFGAGLINVSGLAVAGNDLLLQAISTGETYNIPFVSFQTVSNAWFFNSIGMRGWAGLGFAVGGGVYKNYQSGQPLYCLWCH